MRTSDGLQAEECNYKKINSGIWIKKYKRRVESPISWEWKTLGVCRGVVKAHDFLLPCCSGGGIE